MYEKHHHRSNSNARNSYSKKKLKTTLEETEIQVPMDRESSFNPMLVKKSTTDGLKIVPSLYMLKE